MGKAIKIILITIASLVLLAVIAISSLLFFIDPNHYKDEISQQVYKTTGRQLSINGNISWSIFPGIGLTVNDVVVSNAPGFGPNPFAKLNRAEVSVKLLPLLSKRIETGTIMVNGLQLNLQRHANGETNWDDLTKKFASTAATGSDKPQKAATTTHSQSNNNIKVSISSFDIENAKVSLDDQQKNHKAIINLVLFRAKEINIDGKAFPLIVEMHLQSGSPQLEGEVNLSSKLQLNLAEKKYSFKKLVFVTNLKGVSFPGKKLNLVIQSHGDINLDKQKIDLKQLDISLNGLTAKGVFLIKHINDNPSYYGKINIPTTNVAKWLTSIGRGVHFKNPNALSVVSAKAEFNGTTHSANLKTLEIKVDNAIVKGKLNIQDFAKKKARFDININQLDLDKYLEATTTTSAAPVTAQSTPGVSSASNDTQMPSPLPLKELRQLDLKGHLTIGALHIMNLTTNSINSDVSAKQGVFDLGPSSAKLYGGNYTGDIDIDISGNIPKIKIKEQLSNINIQPLLKDLASLDFIQGNANFAAQMSTQGLDATSMVKHLNGTMSYSLQNGAIEHVNLRKTLNVAVAIFNRKAANTSQDGNATPFTSLTGSMHINNGVARSSDFNLASPALSASGKGVINFNNQQINYKLRIKTIGNIVPHIEALEQALGGGIPIIIQGQLSSPTVRPDEQAILRAMATKEFKQGIDKSIDAVKSFFNR